jgi:hypothetical protein
MRIAVINSSYYGMKKSDRIYNLAVEKIAHYHRLRGDQVYAGHWMSSIPDFAASNGRADKYYFSVIFTWDIPAMIQAVKQVQSWGPGPESRISTPEHPNPHVWDKAWKPGPPAPSIEIGGPAATFMLEYIAHQTGIRPHDGLDMRFEIMPGEYDLTFSSRGCPHGCKFCGVRQVEPNAIEYEYYPIAPMVGDNNILATSWEHQKRFVNTYNRHGFGARSGSRVVDINSGFDVRFFQEEHYDLYSTLKIKTWRFAFDSLNVWDDVWRVANLMRRHGLDRHQVSFYCLMGFPGTAPDESRFRMDSIIALGMNPYPMRFIPLNSLNHRYVAPGWTEEELFKMQTYYQLPFLWKADTYENFRPGKNKQVMKERKISQNARQGELLT